MAMRVLIADDHMIFRESLRHMLGLDPEIDVVGTVGDGGEAIEWATRTKPDIVCMDIKMPGIGGIDATRRLIDSLPDIKIIGLSACADRQYVLDMIGAGARGYVTKSEAPEELRHAIRSVGDNQLYFCPAVAGLLHESPTGDLASQSRGAAALPPPDGQCDAPPAKLKPPPLRREAPAPAGQPSFDLRQAIDGASVPTFVIDHRHMVLHWNRACEALTGIGASEIVGSSDHWQAFYTERRPVMADLIVDGASEAEFERYYGKRCHKSGLIDGAYEGEDFFPRIGINGSWIYFTAAPLYDGGRRPIGSVETLQDFTERRHAEAALQASEARYRQLSITDNLTGLFNSRHFHEQIKSEIGRTLRYAHPLSLLLMDVDNFKQYNDSYGHPEGDKVLRELGRLIRNTNRLGDSGYRLGGEEFAVLLPDTSPESARLAAERLRATFAGQCFHPRPDSSTRSSVSIGVTTYRPYEKYTAFIRRADEGCYAAKRQGRNCVVLV